MESLLETVAGWMQSAWQWAVGLNGALQLPLIVVCCIAGFACGIIGRRMLAPSFNDTPGGEVARTVIGVIAHIAAAVFALLMIFGVCAVFAPLLGLAA